MESALAAGDGSSESVSCFGVNNFWLDGVSAKCLSYYGCCFKDDVTSCQNKQIIKTKLIM